MCLLLQVKETLFTERRAGVLEERGLPEIIVPTKIAVVSSDNSTTHNCVNCQEVLLIRINGFLPKIFSLLSGFLLSILKLAYLRARVGCCVQ